MNRGGVKFRLLNKQNTIMIVHTVVTDGTIHCTLLYIVPY